MPEIRPAQAKDMVRICRLLEAANLPTSDLATAQPQFLVAVDGDEIVAAGALQRFDRWALLRSLVVAPALRGRGLGRLIVQALERAGAADGLQQLVLLTETAKSFFEQRQYEVIDRKAVPTEMQQSEEFRSLCPGSATCMAKTLDSRARKSVRAIL